jgi:hypothetical protein
VGEELQRICLVAPGRNASCGTLEVVSNSDLTTWLVALVGAIVGAAIALGGQRLFERRAARNRHRSRLQALKLELAIVGAEARRRETPEAGGGIRREAPLPTTAWRLLLTSSELERVDEELIRTLAEFYRQVDAANYLAAQAPTYLLIANTASDLAIRDGYVAQARQVTTEPFRAISREVDAAEAAVQKATGG